MVWLEDSLPSAGVNLERPLLQKVRHCEQPEPWPGVFVKKEAAASTPKVHITFSR